MDKQYELRKEYASDHAVSEYSGLPNENNTQGWNDLIKTTWFVASKEMLAMTGESIDNSVMLADGGYLAGLGVYHDIHCLRRLRLYLHADYYYEELTEANLKYLREHLGHCIEALRKPVMCTVDTSIYTFTWDNATERRPNPKSNQHRKCLNWESLQEWLSSTGKKVPLNPMLVRPTGVKDRILMRSLSSSTQEDTPEPKGRRDPR
ncbi:hypothetical protein K491DRAFT_735839 [Lophiostoma macrostomum CBS 122681]|uniref:Uncharacterized protein n=1 Tax=Lophiostoma macrostomum CBS 122681 TaxID=1314788 RepID=A0A6A6SPU6_9PLEO|nr:hypothetical protein K491DRAFT_735839 [Lophiostoma macrostomum CBS 122681]